MSLMTDYLGVGLGGTSVVAIIIYLVRKYMTNSQCHMRINGTEIDVGNLKRDIEEAVKEGVKEEEIVEEIKKTLSRVKTMGQLKHPENVSV